LAECVAQSGNCRRKGQFFDLDGNWTKATMLSIKSADKGLLFKPEDVYENPFLGDLINFCATGDGFVGETAIYSEQDLVSSFPTGQALSRKAIWQTYDFESLTLLQPTGRPRPPTALIRAA
jgi:hypothetical protein